MCDFNHSKSETETDNVGGYYWVIGLIDTLTENCDSSRRLHQRRSGKEKIIANPHYQDQDHDHEE